MRSSRRYRAGRSWADGQRIYCVLWAYDYDGEGIKVSGPTQIYIRGNEIGFHFRPTCGCVAYWRALKAGEEGRRRIAVNLRLADPEAVAQIPMDRFDGIDSFGDLPRDGQRVTDYWF